MVSQALVISPHAAFGELLRLSLEESDKATVRLVRTGGEALSVARRKAFALAVLDSDVTDVPLVELGRELLVLYPDLKLVLISPDGNLRPPAFDGVRYHGVIPRPFYVPDMLSLVERLLHPDPLSVPVAALPPDAPAPAGLPWLHDSTQAANLLNRVLEESSASGALVVFAEQIVAAVGCLKPPVAQEFGEHLFRSLDHQDHKDLARYWTSRLNDTAYLTYGTYLVDACWLVLAYDSNMPLTRVRAQSTRLAREIVSPSRDSQLAAAAQPEPPAPVLTIPQPAPAPAETVDAAWIDAVETGGESIDEGALALNLSRLLADMPSPDPEPFAVGTEQQEWIPEVMLRSPSGGEQFLQELEAAQEFREEARPPDPLPVQPAPLGEQPTRPILVAAAQPEEGEQTPPLRAPVSNAPAITQVIYQCILVPENPGHHLEGKLTDLLREAMPQFCEGLACPLLDMDVKQDYMRWTMRMAPLMSPGKVVRLLRQYTTQLVYNRFPALQGEALNDFWAPGYLIVSGAQPPAMQILLDFVHQTRRRQGFNPPAKEEGTYAAHPVSD